MLTITKIFKFEAAHRLPGYKGKYETLHGHSYRLEVEVVREGRDTDNAGMIVDSNYLTNMFAPVIDSLDHKYLNQVQEMPAMPTAENIIEWIRKNCKLPVGTKLIRLRLWEIDSCYVEWTDQ